MCCRAAHTASRQLRVTPHSINLSESLTEVGVILEFYNQGVPGNCLNEQRLKLTLLFFYANLAGIIGFLPLIDCSTAAMTRQVQ
jgi:hypothetical protein